MTAKHDTAVLGGGVAWTVECSCGDTSSVIVSRETAVQVAKAHRRSGEKLP